MTTHDYAAPPSDAARAVALNAAEWPAQAALAAPPLPVPSARWAMFVDIDGTLVDFCPRPEEVRMDAAVRTLLERLATALDGAVAILSGRPLHDVDRILAPLMLPAGALHGLQQRFADGGIVAHAVAPAVSAHTRSACIAGLRALDGVTLEEKAGYAFALHYRSVPERADAVRRLAQRIAAESGGAYVVQSGNCVAELIPPGIDKGSALRALLERPPFRGRAPVMLGDDLTDEHAFAEAHRHRGFGVIVGDRRPSGAQFALASPVRAIEWLGAVLSTLEARRAAR
jgi:trehalose 6-phosphate phosphatase